MSNKIIFQLRLYKKIRVFFEVIYSVQNVIDELVAKIYIYMID